MIVSDEVGCRLDLVQHGENGYIFPVGAVAELVLLLSTMVQDRALCVQMGERSLEIMQDKHHMAACVEGLRAALNQVIAR